VCGLLLPLNARYHNSQSKVAADESMPSRISK
jgi:hypothetical protein